ncbi:hypothetical protein N5C96_16685 [Delftia tsuruhatensis]|jgi:invasion protein IalB|nr:MULTISPECIES: hypothetical protein [Delftia]MDH0775039.1 hypothetical protein [Delftia tsuruhatensis]MDH1459001.1 hypothetical protein [Delftia tsuruhatensis]WGG11749.1 hypothetical protein N5O86_03705 [Delftia tsuruhatensis]
MKINVCPDALLAEESGRVLAQSAADAQQTPSTGTTVHELWKVRCDPPAQWQRRMTLSKVLGSHSSHATEKFVRRELTTASTVFTKVRSNRFDHFFW